MTTYTPNSNSPVRNTLKEEEQGMSPRLPVADKICCFRTTSVVKV